MFDSSKQRKFIFAQKHKFPGQSPQPAVGVPGVAGPQLSGPHPAGGPKPLGPIWEALAKGMPGNDQNMASAQRPMGSVFSGRPPSRFS